MNIYPIIEAVYKEGSAPMFYYPLSKLLEDLNLSKIGKDFLLSFDGYVKAIRLANNPKAETDSIVFLLVTTFKQLDVQSKNGLTTIYNVTYVKIESNSTLFVEAESFTIENGKGFMLF